MVLIKNYIVILVVTIALVAVSAWSPLTSFTTNSDQNFKDYMLDGHAFNDLVTDAQDSSLRKPTRNIHEREEINENFRKWLISQKITSVNEIPRDTNLITDVITLEGQDDEIVIFTLSDKLMKIIGAEDQPKIWTVKKSLDNSGYHEYKGEELTLIIR